MNIEALRNDTPGSHLHAHLNNAGASLPPAVVLKTVQDYLMAEALHGGYEVAAKHAPEIAGFYDATAELLRTKASYIAFATSATDAYFRALSSIPFEAGDTILTTDDDYVSNQIAFIFLQKRFKVKLLRAAKLPEGGVDPQSVKELMQAHRPKLVAVAHVPTNSGLVQDVEAIGQLCREYNTWYMVDACQSAGQMHLDVEKIGCDFLCATTRKWLRGPRGAGFLFASDRALDAGLEMIFPDMSGGVWSEAEAYIPEKSAKRYEQWEKSYALLLGAKSAIEYANNLGLGAIESAVTALSAYARQQFAQLDSAKILDLGHKKCGIVTVHFAQKSPTDIRQALEKANVSAGIGTVVNALIDFQEKGVDWAVRISPHYYNTKEEIDLAVNAIAEIL